MADIQPALAPQPELEGADAAHETSSSDAPPPAPITEQEVGEYREQDRFLPVSPFFSLVSLTNPIRSPTSHVS